MPINSSQISSTPLSQATNFAIEIVYSPVPSDYQLATPRTPGQLIGFYNNATRELKLYVVNPSGNSLGVVR